MIGLRIAFWWLLVGAWTLLLAFVYSKDKDGGEALATVAGAIGVILALAYMLVQFVS